MIDGCRRRVVVRRAAAAAAASRRRTERLRVARPEETGDAGGAESNVEELAHLGAAQRCRKARRAGQALQVLLSCCSLHDFNSLVREYEIRSCGLCLRIMR